MLLEVANHLWQSTLFAGGVAGLCFLLRYDGAHLRYRLWWLASIKFLIPFALFTDLGRWLGARAAIGPLPEAWTNTMTVVARPFEAGAGSFAPGILLLAVWAAGTLALLLRWMLRALQLRRVVSSAERDPAPLAAGRHRVPVYRAHARIEPGVVGILGTALLLPAGIEQRLSTAQLESVIAHELCHVRRRDNLTAAVHMFVEAVFWFFPLVWWLGARLIDERERACDEMVVALGHDPRTYARSILDVCEHFAASPLRCAAGISGSDLKRRITQIMRYEGMKTLKLRKKLLLAASAIATITIPLLGGIYGGSTAWAQAEPQPLPTQRFSPEEIQAIREQLGNLDDPAAIAAVEGEYLPIVKVAPVYPPRAAARGLEGYVVVSYTVRPDGSTDDVEVLESSATLFEQSAIESATKYKYKPRVIDGTAVAVPGVTTKIVYAFSGNEPVQTSPPPQSEQ